MILREEQKECVELLRTCEDNEILIVLPTGTGKTVIFHELLRDNVKTLILFNRISLLKEQLQRALDAGLNACAYSASVERRLDASVVLASVQSLKDVNLSMFKRIIIDECHNVNYSVKESDYTRILESFEGKIIGFTATPYRQNGFIYGKGKLFKKVHYFKSLKWAIDNGRLVKPICKSANAAQFNTSSLKIVAGDYSKRDLTELTGDNLKIKMQIEHLILNAVGRKSVVVACCNIAHAEKVALFLREKNESAIVLHSEVEQDRRDDDLKIFKSGQVRFLVFVAIVKEGFDCPRIDCVVFMRPTRSANMYVQIAGRGLRLYKDKTDCLILDYGQVISTLGSLNAPLLSFQHSSKKPDDVVENIEVKVKVCPKCSSYVESFKKICGDCGHEFKTEFKLSKNLTSLSFSGDILETKVHTLNVDSVKLDKHLSANNNLCLRVTYVCKDIYGQRAVTEFFSWNNQFAYRKACFRLAQLQIKNDGVIDSVVKQSVLRVPKKIDFTLNRFYEIKNLHF